MKEIRKQNAFEMCIWRKIEKMSWKEKSENEEFGRNDHEDEKYYLDWTCIERNGVLNV